MTGAPRRLSLLVLAALLAAGSLAGCYRRHGRGDAIGRDAATERDAGQRDAGPPRDGGRLPDAGVERCGSWAVTSRLQLTEPPSDDHPRDVRRTGEGCLIGFQSSNPGRDQARFAQLVNDGVVLAPPRRVFEPPFGFYGAMGLPWRVEPGRRELRPHERRPWESPRAGSVGLPASRSSGGTAQRGGPPTM